MSSARQGANRDAALEAEADQSQSHAASSSASLATGAPSHADAATVAPVGYGLAMPAALDPSAAASAAAGAAAAAAEAFSVPTTPISPLRNLYYLGSSGGGGAGGDANRQSAQLPPAQLYPLQIHSPVGIDSSPGPASPASGGAAPQQQQTQQGQPPLPFSPMRAPFVRHQRGQSQVLPPSTGASPRSSHASPSPSPSHALAPAPAASSSGGPARGSIKARLARATTMSPGAFFAAATAKAASATGRPLTPSNQAAGSASSAAATATAAASSTGAAATPSHGGRLRSPTMDSSPFASHSPTFSSQYSGGSGGSGGGSSSGGGGAGGGPPFSLLVSMERRPSQLHLLSPTAAAGGIVAAASGIVASRGHARRPSNAHRRAPSLVLFTPSSASASAQQQQQQQQQPRGSSLLRRSSLGPLGASQMQAAVAAAAASAAVAGVSAGSGSAAATPSGASRTNSFGGFMQAPMGMLRRQSLSNLNVSGGGGSGSAVTSPSAGMQAVQAIQAAAAMAAAQTQAQAQSQPVPGQAAAVAQSFFQLHPNFNPAYAVPAWVRAANTMGGAGLGAEGDGYGGGTGVGSFALDFGDGDTGMDELDDAAAVRDVLESGAVVDLGPSVCGGGTLDAAMVARLRLEESLRARMLERTFTLLFLLLVISSLDGGSLPACLLSLRSDVAHMSFTRLGLLGSLNFLGLIVGGFVSGPALERWDQPGVVGAGMAAQAVLLFLLGAVPNAPLMLLCRFLIGVAQAPLVVFAPVWVAAHAHRAALGAPLSPPVTPTAAGRPHAEWQAQQQQAKAVSQQSHAYPSGAALASTWTTLLHVATPISIALGFLVGIACSVQDERASSGLGPDPSAPGWDEDDGEVTGPGSDRPWKWAFISQALVLLPLAVAIVFVPRRLISTKDVDTRSAVPSAASAAAMLHARAAAMREYEALLRFEQQQQHLQSTGPDSSSSFSGAPPFPAPRAPPRLHVSPSPQSIHSESTPQTSGAALLRSAPGSFVSLSSMPSSASNTPTPGSGKFRLRHLPGPLEAQYTAAPGGGGVPGSSPPTSFAGGLRRDFWLREGSDGSVALAPSSSSAFVSGSAFPSPSGSFFRSDGSMGGGGGSGGGIGGVEIAPSPLLSLGLGIGDAEWRALDEAAHSDALVREAVLAEHQPAPLWDSMDFASMFSPRHRVVTWSWSPAGRGGGGGSGGAGTATTPAGSSGPLWPPQSHVHLGVEEPSSVRWALHRAMGVARALRTPLLTLLRTPLYVAMVASLCALYFILAGFHFWVTAFLVSTYSPSLHLSTAGLLYAVVALVATPLGVWGGHGAMRVLEKRIDARFEHREAVRRQIAELDRRAAMGVDAGDDGGDGDHGGHAPYGHGYSATQKDENRWSNDTEGHRARLLSKHIFAVILALALVLALLCLLLGLAPVWPTAARTAHPALAFLLVFMMLLTGGALVPCCQWILEGAMWGAAGAAGVAAAADAAEQPGVGPAGAAAAATSAGEEMIALAHACAQLCYNLLGYFLSPLVVGALMQRTSSAGPRQTSDLAQGFALDLGWSAVLLACLCAAGALQWRQCAHDKMVEEIARAVRMTTVDEGDEGLSEEVAHHHHHQARSSAPFPPAAGGTSSGATSGGAGAGAGAGSRAPHFSNNSRLYHARSQSMRSSTGTGAGSDNGHVGFGVPATSHGAGAVSSSSTAHHQHHRSLPLLPPEHRNRSGSGFLFGSSNSSGPSATASLPHSGAVTPTTLAVHTHAPVDDLNNTSSSSAEGFRGGGGGLPVWVRSGSIVSFDTGAADDSSVLLHSQGRGTGMGGMGGGGSSMRRSASAASSLGLSAGFFVPARPPGFEELGSVHAHAAPFAPMRLVAHQRTPSLYRLDSVDSSDPSEGDASGSGLGAAGAVARPGVAFGLQHAPHPASDNEEDGHDDDDDDNYMLYGRAMQDD